MSLIKEIMPLSLCFFFFLSSVIHNYSYYHVIYFCYSDSYVQTYQCIPLIRRLFNSSSVHTNKAARYLDLLFYSYILLCHRIKLSFDGSVRIVNPPCFTSPDWSMRYQAGLLESGLVSFELIFFSKFRPHFRV